MTGFGERIAEKQRTKELKNKLKTYKNILCDDGVDKNTAGTYIKELQETLESAARMKADYQSAKDYFLRAYERMERMLDDMERQSEGEIKISLEALVKELKLSVHDCLFRKDDMDFVSSRNCLERMSKGGTLSAPGMSIMLRSELENLYAVFSDAKEWQDPDFFAYAYYLLHEDRESLAEMGNDQRARFVDEYEKEHFGRRFFLVCVHADIAESVRQTIQDYIYGGLSFERMR